MIFVISTALEATHQHQSAVFPLQNGGWSWCRNPPPLNPSSQVHSPQLLPILNWPLANAFYCLPIVQIIVCLVELISFALNCLKSHVPAVTPPPRESNFVAVMTALNGHLANQWASHEIHQISAPAMQKVKTPWQPFYHNKELLSSSPPSALSLVLTMAPDPSSREG